MTKQIVFCIWICSICDAAIQNHIYFGKQTPYSLIENENTNIVSPNLSDCKSVQINMIHRHGNRYPSNDDVEDILSMSKKINTAKSITINLTLPWSIPFSGKEDTIMSNAGEYELYNIGVRLRKRFPALFVKDYSPLNYKFDSACKLRNVHSSNSLAAGLFDNQGNLGPRKLQSIAIGVHPCRQNPVLRFYDDCQNYETKVRDNKTAFIEYSKFIEGPEVKSVMKKVQQRLGLPDTELTFKDLKSIFVSCAYDIGMFKGVLGSGICALFDSKDMDIMEYAADMNNFYESSRGHVINYTISCPLLKDISDSLKQATENDPNEKQYSGIFRSGNSRTILPFLALLDLFPDKYALNHTNYADMKDRNFRSGKLAPFSSNVYFILYNCKEGHQVQMYVNERLTKIPCCSSATECDLNTFLKCYESIVSDCNLPKMCAVKKEATSSALQTLAGLIPLLSCMLVALFIIVIIVITIL